MEFVLNSERQQFALTHHDLRVARLRRDKEMKAKAIEDEKKLELTFKPQINQEYQLKNKDDDFFQRLEKYEQSRKLKMAELHKEEWKRLQKETEKINLLSPRSHYILNKKKARDTDKSYSTTDKEGDNDNDKNNKSIRIREQNFVDTNRVDWKTGDELFQPKINQRSKELIGDEPSDRYGTGSTSKNVGEMLYRNAFNRKLRKVLAQRRLDEYDEFMRNKSKASKRTMTIMKKALMRDIEVAFHATTGLRNETSSLNDSIGFRNNSPTTSTNKKQSLENEHKKRSVFSSPFDDDDDNNHNSLDVNVLYEAEELLHTMYILSFIPSFASNYIAENSDSDIQSIKDMKDNEFIERLWNALATKRAPAGKSSIGENTTATTSTTSSTASFLGLAKLRQFLVNVIYPNADSNKIEGEREGLQQQMEAKAPVVNISLTLDSDDEEDDTLNKDAHIKHGNVDEAEINKQLYNAMVREVRFLYKKIMPSGYRSLESRQKKEKNLNSSPSTSPKNTRRNSKKGSGGGKREKHIHSLEAKELEECTFKPKINKYKKSKIPVDVKKNNKISSDPTGSVTVSSSKSNKSRREDILLAKYKLTKGKHALARKNQREFEAKECTFQPDLSLSRKSMQYLSKSEGGGKNSNRKKKLVEEVTLTTEEREYRKHCTFTPKFVSKSIPTNYYRNKSGSSSSSSNKYKQKKTPNSKKTQNKKIEYGMHDGWLVHTSPDKDHHTPRAYEQAISRMRQAREKRNATKYLEDVHATLRSGHRTSPSKDLPDDHRDARGRLRSKPFKFSTEIRHERRAHQSALKKLGYRGTNGRLLHYSRGTDPFTAL